MPRRGTINFKISVMFQFSIGDAVERGLDTERDIAHHVSILYWRCRVLWTFECVGF